MQSRTLYNGIELPMIGYGTFQIRDSVQCEQCVSEALKTGYRLFDTAASYECFILGKHTARNGVAGISPPRREFQKC